MASDYRETIAHVVTVSSPTTTSNGGVTLRVEPATDDHVTVRSDLGERALTNELRDAIEGGIVEVTHTGVVWRYPLARVAVTVIDTTPGTAEAAPALRHAAVEAMRAAVRAAPALLAVEGDGELRVLDRSRWPTRPEPMSAL